MLEYGVKKSVWGFHDSDYGDSVYETSYQLEFADVIYYALRSKGASFKMIFSGIENFPYKYEGFLQKKCVPKTCDDLIKEAKIRQKEAKRYNKNYDRYKGLYEIPEYNIDILSDFTYRDFNACSLQPSTIFIPMIEAWQKYFNVLSKVNVRMSALSHFACLEILVNESESNKIYKKSQDLLKICNGFYSYCLENHKPLLNKIIHELKGSEHIAINKYGIYSRCGQYGIASEKQDIQKGPWHERPFSSFEQKNLNSDEQVIGFSLALMKLIENGFDILHYFDNGTFLMWLSRKEEPVVIQEILKVEPVKLNEW